MGICQVKYQLPSTRTLLYPPCCCSGTLDDDRMTVRHLDSCSSYPKALDASGLVLDAGDHVENWQEREDLALEKGWKQKMPSCCLHL